MANVTVRRAVREDLPSVLTLLEDVDDLHRRAMPWLFRKAPAPQVTGFLDEYVTSDAHAMFLAVTAEGTLMGVLYMYLRNPARAPIVQPTTVAEIDLLAVDGGARRQGVGTDLVRAAFAWAKDKGATRTELGVYEFNEPARAFWASVGFETLSRRLVLHTP